MAKNHSRKVAINSISRSAFIWNSRKMEFSQEKFPNKQNKQGKRRLVYSESLDYQ